MIKSIHVRCYNGKGGFSNLIKWFTFGSFSHVSLILTLNDNSIKECEAREGRGVQVKDPELFGDFVDLFVPITEDQRIGVYNLFCDLLGADYDWKGIWGFMRRRDRNNPDKWFCSELVAYLLLKVGYPISRREPYQETPTSVYESLRLLETKEAGHA